MNILYEENGSFKVASIMVENDSSLQIESASGKRSKIKAASVLLRFKQPELEQFIESAEALAQDLDVAFLWECAPQEEFDFETFATEYYGQKPSAQEAAAVLFCLHNGPIYFHKKGKGRFRAAPEEILKAALAGAERKRQQQALQETYIEQLTRFELPEAFNNQIANLLYCPDRNTIEVKALEAACITTHLSTAHLLYRCGGIRSTHDFHLHRFLFEHFPKGTDFPPISLGDWDTLPEANVSAFSIDDATTTEIDDAFSLTLLDSGNWQVGVHIAAPALGLHKGSEGDALGARRLSTVYMPGQKITMLPDEVVNVFTLCADSYMPAVSMYLEVHPETLEILSSESRVNKIHIAANLRHDTLEPLFNSESLQRGDQDYAYGKELTFLWRFANKLEEKRGKSSDNNIQQLDYNFHIENDWVTITNRHRGSPIDKVVSELMILVNSEWGRQLAEKDLVGIYRSQQNGKVRMSTVAAPHQGLGVAQYMWSSSPLRRYVDLVNQRQIIAMLTNTPAPHAKNDPMIFAAIRDFEVAYGVYGNFQRNMERYWCLRWLQQEQKTEIQGTLWREGLVRMSEIPLVIKVSSLPPDLPINSQVRLKIGEIDLLDLEIHTTFIAQVEIETC